MALLARVADRVYWGARYTERAEDTARIVRAFGDLYVDFPVAAGLRWDPLIAIGGTSPGAILGDGADHRDNGEAAVLHHLIVDTANPGSISASHPRSGMSKSAEAARVPAGGCALKAVQGTGGSSTRQRP